MVPYCLFMNIFVGNMLLVVVMIQYSANEMQITNFSGCALTLLVFENIHLSYPVII